MEHLPAGTTQPSHNAPEIVHGNDLMLSSDVPDRSGNECSNPTMHNFQGAAFQIVPFPECETPTGARTSSPPDT
jgi:hypothetical protein